MNIIEAAKNGNLTMIQELIQSGANVNIADNSGMTPLMHASRLGDINIVRALIAAGAGVNITDIQNRTSIGFAVNEGYIDIVHALIEAGANVNIANFKGRTPLDHASVNNNTDMIRVLINAGADVNLMYSDKLRPKPVSAPRVRLTEVIPENEENNSFARRLQCKVCMDNAVNTRLNPCGHLLCSTCYTGLPTPKMCPICRVTPVTNENIFYGGYYNKLQKYINKLK